MALVMSRELCTRKACKVPLKLSVTVCEQTSFSSVSLHAHARLFFQNKHNRNQEEGFFNLKELILHIVRVCFIPLFINDTLVILVIIIINGLITECPARH